MFSHWQGRLDPRAMILGSTTRGVKVGIGLSEDVRGLDLLEDGRHQHGAVITHPEDPQIAENETEETMEVRIIAYF